MTEVYSVHYIHRVIENNDGLLNKALIMITGGVTRRSIFVSSTQKCGLLHQARRRDVSRHASFASGSLGLVDCASEGLCLETQTLLIISFTLKKYVQGSMLVCLLKNHKQSSANTTAYITYVVAQSITILQYIGIKQIIINNLTINFS